MMTAIIGKQAPKTIPTNKKRTFVEKCLRNDMTIQALMNKKSQKEQ
jgi:hypothetical protein